MTTAIGRNDPCHCGSGKKYKKCHWAEDQKAVASRAAAEKARRARMEAMGHPTDAQIRGYYEEMTGRAVPAGPLTAEIREMVTELWQQDQLNDQARQQLEPEMEKWEQHFAADPDAFERIASELSGEPLFEQYELTDENIAKVRAAHGELPEAGEARRGYATEAITLSLDEEDRENFRDAILSLLPDLVESGRMEEAYVALTCAERVLDPEAPLSPFLEDVVVRSMGKA